jgi:ATP-binding protein involved in chromosome partitioning
MPTQTFTGSNRAAPDAVAVVGIFDQTARSGGLESLAGHATAEDIRVDDERLVVTLALPGEMAKVASALVPALEQSIARAFPDFKPMVILTAHRSAPASPAAPRKAAGHRPLGGIGKPEGAPMLEGVGSVIAVASGKGGVGKSTTALNLAVALADMGLKTGLVDLDVHGPSLPRMLGVRDVQPEVKSGRLQPVQAWGISAMSIGLMVNEEQAMIWRGPMVMGAVTQLLGDVDWGRLDVLVLDLPPGTGDAQLTLAQKVKLAGALIVSTPQDIALLDARRGFTMFEKTGVPVLGLVENMSYFCCPECGHRTELFGHGGARREAEKLGVPFLGEVPLLPEIRFSADEGRPIVHTDPESPAGQAYRKIAGTIATALRKGKPA